MKKINLLLPLVLLNTQATAQDFNGQISCQTRGLEAQTKTYVEYVPSYFTKSVPIPMKDKATFFQGLLANDEDLGTYIADTGGDNNRIVRLNSDREDREIPVPGPYDPVPSPDGRIMSVAAPMRIYDTREFLVDGHQPRAILDDLTSGVYQSIAWLRGEPLKVALTETYKDITCNSSNVTNGCKIILHYRKMQFDKQRIYRLITDDSDGLPVIDILVNFKEDCNVAETVKADPNKHCIEAKVISDDNYWDFCPNLSMKTLFISRRGTYISGYVDEDGYGTSKIYDMTRPNECREVLDLGYPAGKIDFNDAEDKLVYHLDYLGSDVGAYFSGVSDYSTKDVFVLNLIKDGNKLKGENLVRHATTTQRGMGCYYPSFFFDGTQDANGNPTERFLCMFDHGEDEIGNYSFLTVDITDFNSSIQIPIPPRNKPDNATAQQRKDYHVRTAMGMIWGKLCNPEDEDEYSAVQSASLFLGMDIYDCDRIVDIWQENKHLRNSIINSVKFEDDPRYGNIDYLERTLTAEQFTRVCNINREFHQKLNRKYADNRTKIVGKDSNGEFTPLTGEEIAKRKCTGCHHAGINLNPVLGDLDEGVAFYPNDLEFGRHPDINSLMHLDASLERIGYNPLAYMVENPDAANWLGPRIMPPPNRVELRVEGDYDERKILAEYLYELRAKLIESMEQEGGR